MPQVHVPGELWGVTTYFNPARYSNKLHHLRLFSENVRGQGLRLLVVELAFGDQRYEVDEDVADKIVRLRSATVLWHKERLLNIAIGALPGVCDKVAWLDADILFLNQSWIEQTAQLLERYFIVQPYAKVCFLPPALQGVPPGYPGLELPSEWPTAPGAAFGEGHDVPCIQPACQPGFAWAARRSVVTEHGLYDRLIVGGADALFAVAMFGHFQQPSVLEDISTICSEAQRDDILKWATRFYNSVRRNVWFTGGTVCHWWHGNFVQRKYKSRYKILKDAAFDPCTDISLDSNNCWQWATDKPELHHGVKEYFWSRKEETV